MTWYAVPAIAAAFYGLFVGLFVPDLIARIPEPEPEEQETGAAAAEHPVDGADGILGATGDADQPAVAEVKEPYAAIARLRGLRWKASVATALAAGVMAGRVGWGPDLVVLLYLAPVGVALAVVDWRTRLLPTKLIAPSYGIVIGLVLLAAWLDHDLGSLERAGWGWLVAGGTFFGLWFIYPKGMGYGDVRLSGVLGIALGYLGWGELLTGVYAGFLLGGIGGVLLSSLRIVDRKAYPFGPFMLLGAVVGIVVGPYVASWYA
jgi:leader peptidase (prepilin peptidase)/N-methyltransferase